MTFVYFPYEFYRISNAIAYKTLILNYNGKFSLGICLFINVNFDIQLMVSNNLLYI